MIRMQLPQRRPFYVPGQDDDAEERQRQEDELRTRTLAPVPNSADPMQQMARSLQQQGAANARDPVAAAGAESTLGEDMAALGLAIAGQRYSDMQQDDAIRRSAVADTGWQQARKLHAPVYGIQAVAARNRMESNAGGLDYLAPLLDYYRGGRR